MCNSCEALMINGVYCHETGCPDSHLSADNEPYEIECKWCGTLFTPYEKGQYCCDSACLKCYNT